MSKNLKIKLTVDADGNVKGVLTDTNKQLDKFEDKAHKAGGATNQLTQTVRNFKAVAIGAFAGFGIVELTSDVISATKVFQGLKASLVTVTGSAYAADLAFSNIQQFAKTTPFQLSEVTESFIKMQALGLDPSERAMRSYGDTSSSMGKSLNQMVEAVADAATGEFDRLKEFGIRASSEGNRVTFTFKNVATEVGKNSAEIEEYLIALGEVNFSGGMALQMDTIGGKLSNMEGAWQKAFNALGEGSQPMITTAIDGMSSLANSVEEMGGYLDEAVYLIEIGLVGAITARAIPALYGMATATTVASAANVGLIATTKAATAAALAFTLTPIGAAMTLIAGGAAYLALKEDEAKIASDELTESLEAQNIEMSKSDINIKAQELVNYREQLQRLTRAKSQNRAIDIFDVKEDRLKRAINVLLAGITEVKELTKGKVGLDLYAEFDAQLAILDKLEDAKLDKELEAAIREEEQQAKSYTVKEALLSKLFDLTASEAEKRQSILLTLSAENKLLQERIWLAEDAKKNKPKAATGDWSSMLDDQTAGFDGEADALQAKITSLTASTNEFGEAWTRTGNKILDAMSSAGQVLEKTNKKESDYAKKSLKIQDARADNDEVNSENFAQWKKNELALSKEQDKLEKDRVQNSLSGSMAMLDASVAMFEEGSEAQKIAHQASLVIHGIEMAMNIQKAISAATVAVATQGQGDPYTAWIRIAAMSVMMGGLISQMGASFGGASGSAPSLSYVNSPDGSPLGSDDPSESLANSLEFYEDIQADQYHELRDINRGMKDLNNNLTGVVSSLYRTGDLAQISAIAESFNTQSSDTGGFLGNLVSSIFGGGSSSSVVDYGLAATSFNLGGSADLRGYNQVREDTDGGWFGSSSTHFYDIYSDISGESERLFNLVFDNLKDTTISLGQELGLSIEDKVNNFTISLGKISTEGKTGEEVEEALSEAISGQADRIAYNFFGGLIDDFGKLSEGAYETISRLIGERSVITDVLDMTNTSLVGDAIELSQALINIAGGLDELRDSADSYYDAFFSEAEKALRAQEHLTEALAYQNIVLPDVRSEYRALVESLDLSAEAGQEQYVTLMNLSEAADDYYSQMEQSQREMIQTTLDGYRSLKDALTSTYDSITQSTTVDSLQYMDAQATLSGALDSARSGTLPELESISDALSAVSRNTMDGYASIADFNHDQLVTANMVDELLGYTNAAISVEDQMLTELQAQTFALQNLSIVTVDGSIDGSHYNGIYSVPFDGYRAELHYDESVIDARTMQGMRQYGIPVNTGSNQDVVNELRGVRADLSELQKVFYNSNLVIANHTQKMALVLDGFEENGITTVAL